MKPANRLKIKTLGKDWADADSLILHACFQILVDFVEIEKGFECHVDWDSNQDSIWTKKEALALYNWWKSYDEPSIPGSNGHLIENEMLRRLVYIRMYLWT